MRKIMRDFKIKAEEKRKLLKKARDILKKWKLVLPEKDTLVLDFRLGDFFRYGHIEYSIVNLEEENYCGKFIFMFEGQTCPAHRHRKKNETFFLLRGKVKMLYENKKRILEPGDVLIMRVGNLHSFSAMTDSLLLEVSQASVPGDNFFKDRLIGIL